MCNNGINFQKAKGFLRALIKSEGKMFSVGEKIVYPMHGAGVIEAVETKKLTDKTVDYYKVRITNGNIMLMIPVDNPSGVQLRPVISKDTAQKVLDDFDPSVSESDIPWNKRYKYNLDRLKTGSVQNVVSVLSELIVREKNHGLSTSDRKMFILTKNILCSELSVALESDSTKIFETIISKF